MVVAHIIKSNMQKIKLTKVYRNDKDKDGKPFVSKEGRPYSKIAVKCVEHGDQYLNGFSAYWNRDWIEGMVVETEIEEVVIGGKTYLNLKKPDPLAELEARVTELERLISLIMSQPQGVNDKKDKEIPF